MESRSFLAGIIVGALACGGTVWLLRPAAVGDPTVSARPSPSPSGLTQADSGSGAAPATTATTARAEVSAAPVGLDVAPRPTGVSQSEEPLPIGEDQAVLPPAEQIGVAESHRSLVPEGAEPDRYGDSPSKRHAALETEPREDAWAPFMEQAVQQSLATHPKIAAFDVLGVVCRSASCEIQVLGFGEGAGPEWSSILFDMRDQPWFEFEESASWSSSVEGGLALVSFLGNKD